MLTSVQLFRDEHKLTACALREPSLTLVRNDLHFGLLVSEDAHEDSFGSSFHLDQVTYLRINGKRWCYTGFDSVTLFHDEGVWFAQDDASKRYFPNPSHCPYHVVFISRAEYQAVGFAMSKKGAFAVFKFAQQHFGRLPGFSFSDESLDSPDDYATLGDAVPASKYVLTSPEVSEKR